jgi:hypothetical protein
VPTPMIQRAKKPPTEPPTIVPISGRGLCDVGSGVASLEDVEREVETVEANV